MFCEVCEDTGIEICPECEGKDESFHCNHCNDLREVDCLCREFIEDEEFIIGEAV